MIKLPWIGDRRVGRFRLRDALALSDWSIEALDTLALFLGERVPGGEEVEHSRAGEAILAARVHFEHLAQLAGGRARPDELSIARLIAQGMVDLRRAVTAVDEQLAPTLARATGQPDTIEGALVRAILAEYKVRMDSQLPDDADQLAETSRAMAPGSPQISARLLPASDVLGVGPSAPRLAVAVATSTTMPASETVSPTRARRRRATDPGDRRYPRPAWFRAGRWVARYAWLFVGFVFTALGARVVSHSVLGSGDISDLQNVIQSPMAARHLAPSTNGLLLMVGVVVLMALLGVASSRARADRRREYAVLKLRARASARATASHSATAASAVSAASTTPPSSAVPLPAAAPASAPTDASAPGSASTAAAEPESLARDESARSTPKLK